MNDPILVVKSHNTKKVEHFDSEKLERSIIATCRSLKTPDGQAEDIARRVAQQVQAWAHDRQEITSADIRRIGANALQKLHPEAAYLYKQQLTVL